MTEIKHIEVINEWQKNWLDNFYIINIIFISKIHRTSHLSVLKFKILKSGRGTRDQIANICCIIEKARKFQKNIYFCFIDYAKAFDCVDHNKLWKILQEMGAPDHLICLLWICMQVKKQQLEPDMEQRTGFKLRKEYIKDVYCHPAYLAYMQSASCEMSDWMRHKLVSRLPGEISITSDMSMTPPLWQKVKRN